MQAKTKLFMWGTRRDHYSCWCKLLNESGSEVHRCYILDNVVHLFQGKLNNKGIPQEMEEILELSAVIISQVVDYERFQTVNMHLNTENLEV